MTGSVFDQKWRVGRKVGRTIYQQIGVEPSDDDPLIGVMDSPELALRAVALVPSEQRVARLEHALRKIRAICGSSISKIGTQCFDIASDALDEVTELSDSQVEQFINQGNTDCPACGEKMERIPHPYNGDSWIYRCPNRHQLWVGK